MVRDIPSLGDLPVTNYEFSKSAKPYDVERYRKLVPAAYKEGTTYLNVSFQQPFSSFVRQAIDEYLDEGQNLPYPKPKWVRRVEETRVLLGKLLNVAPETLAFTRDTTEALNLFQRSLVLNAGDNVVVLDVEHVNQMYGWLALECEKAIEVRQLSTVGKEMFVDGASFELLVDEHTKAIGISSIMFHSGQKNDVKDICTKFRSRGIHVVADITQDVGFMPVDLKSLNVSAAAFSCHKALGCPAGLGVLYIDPQALPTLRPVPPIVGAGAITNLGSNPLLEASKVLYHPTTRRYEHLNVSMISIHAMHASLKFYLDDAKLDSVEEHLRGLGRALVTELKPLGVKIIGPTDVRKCAPHLYVLQIRTPEWKGHFENHGIVVTHNHLGVRVSFGFYNNYSDVKMLGNAIREGLAAGLQLE